MLNFFRADSFSNLFKFLGAVVAVFGIAFGLYKFYFDDSYQRKRYTDDKVGEFLEEPLLSYTQDIDDFIANTLKHMSDDVVVYFRSDEDMRTKIGDFLNSEHYMEMVDENIRFQLRGSIIYFDSLVSCYRQGLCEEKHIIRRYQPILSYYNEFFGDYIRVVKLEGSSFGVSLSEIGGNMRYDLSSVMWENAPPPMPNSPGPRNDYIEPVSSDPPEVAPPSQMVLEADPFPTPPNHDP